MADHRFEAHTVIEHGECAARVGGGRVQLVRVVLTDAAPIVPGDGREQRRSDVVCSLEPTGAMKLALRLLELAPTHGWRGHEAPTLFTNFVPRSVCCPAVDLRCSSSEAATPRS